MILIEKIAKALHDDLARESSSDGHKRYWETAPVQVKMLCLRQAKVAYEVTMAELEKPTPEMLDAGAAYIGFHSEASGGKKQDANHAFQAMLDEFQEPLLQLRKDT